MHAFRPSDELAASSAHAYTVASIKPNKSSDDRFMLRPLPGGGLTATGVTLKMLIGFAYGVFAYQISGGPARIGTERWDIQAKTDGAEGRLPPAQSGALLRALIEDRFQLKARRETKEMPVYALVVAKNGSKLLPSDPAKDKPSAMLGGGSGAFTDSSMAVFAARLSEQLGRPVIDRTDLKGEAFVESVAGKPHVFRKCTRPPGEMVTNRVAMRLFCSGFFVQDGRGILEQ